MQCCMYVYAISKSLLVKGAGMTTYKDIANKLRWSFYWLWLGRHPTHDEYGNMYEEGTEEYRLATEEYWLADGLFAMIWRFLGDMELY